jgi:nucleotide-binding universal stress UspA family protein
MLRLDDILLARDFSAVSDQALRYALDLAARTGARLHLLYAEVLHEDPFASSEQPSPGDDLDRIRDQMRQGGGEGTPDPYDVDVTEAVVRDVAAAPAILNYAENNDVDLLALGTHGRRGVRRVLIGSVAEEVVRRANRPVLTVRGEKDEDEELAPEHVHPPMVRRILVPVDFSEHSREALRTAQALSTVYDAEVDLLHVIEESLHPAFYVGGVRSVMDVDPDLESKARDELAKLADTVGLDDPGLYVAKGRASAEIIDFAGAHAIDLVAMSTHGQTGLEHFLLGSVSEKVVRHVRCPVLTAKAFGHSLVRPEEA